MYIAVTLYIDLPLKKGSFHDDVNGKRQGSFVVWESFSYTQARTTEYYYLVELAIFYYNDTNKVLLVY
jgi:hypothetical protein